MQEELATRLNQRLVQELKPLLLDEAALPSNEKALFAFLRRRAENVLQLGVKESGKAVSISYAVQDCGELQAGAIRLDAENYVLLLCKGVPLLLGELFLRIGNREDLPASVSDGTPSLEYIERLRADTAPIYTHWGEVLQNARKPFLVAPDRVKKSRRWLWFAVDFILCHEAAHIFRGHLGFFPGGAYTEFIYGPNTKERLAALTRQALEYDADRDATLSSFGHQFRVFQLDTKAVADSNKSIGQPAWQEFFYDWTFALAVTMKAFMRRQGESFELQRPSFTKQHPPTAARFLSAIGYAIDIVRTAWGDHPSLASNMVRVGFAAEVHAEIAISVLTGKQLDFFSSLGIHSKDDFKQHRTNDGSIMNYCIPYVETLLKELLRILPALNRHAILPRINPEPSAER